MLNPVPTQGETADALRVDRAMDSDHPRGQASGPTEVETDFEPRQCLRPAEKGVEDGLRGVVVEVQT